jgi:hypothetical protein
MSILDPVWIKPATITTKTEDPLGLDRVSNRLTSDMLTGITALTRRARYYSFYVWIIKNINDTENINSFDQFENVFFDRERAYAMACIAHEQSGLNPNGDHSNILGSQKGGPKWRETGSKLKMRGFRHLGNRLGGYGYYYQASIRNLGLTEQEQIRDILTPLGRKLAESFEKSISQTEYYRKFIGKDTIPKSVLNEYGTKCCLCLLCRRDAPDRDILRDIVFGKNQDASGNRYHQNRQSTLALILYDIYILSQQLEPLDEQKFLDIAYFNQFASKETVRKCGFPSQLQETLENWKIFRSHDYFSYACESLFHFFLRTLDINRATGLSFSNFIDLVNNVELVKELSFLLEAKLNAKSSKAVLLNDILLKIASLVSDHDLSHFDSDVSKEFDSNCNLRSRINEQIIATKIHNAIKSNKAINLSKATVWASLILLLLYVRFYWRSKTKDMSWRWLVLKSESDLSPLRLIFQLKDKLSNPNYTMFDFVSWIYKDYILTQAINIYNKKSGSSLYSRQITWFHPDGEIYRIDRLYDPRFRNSRFYSCLNILSDLGLCINNGNHYELTLDGKHLLKELGIW